MSSKFSLSVVRPLTGWYMENDDGGQGLSIGVDTSDSDVEGTRLGFQFSSYCNGDEPMFKDLSEDDFNKHLDTKAHKTFKQFLNAEKLRITIEVIE